MESRNILFLLTIYKSYKSCLTNLTYTGYENSVWPDVEIKSSPNFSKLCPKSSHFTYYWKMMLFKQALKVAIHLGNFHKWVCLQNFEKSPNLVILYDMLLLIPSEVPPHRSGYRTLDDAGFQAGQHFYLPPKAKQTLESPGGRHSSMVASAPTILRPGFVFQAHHLHFFNLYYWNCNEKRTKINKKRPGLAHFLKKTIGITSCSCWIFRLPIPICLNWSIIYMSKNISLSSYLSINLCLDLWINLGLDKPIYS